LLLLLSRDYSDGVSIFLRGIEGGPLSLFICSPRRNQPLLSWYAFGVLELERNSCVDALIWLWVSLVPGTDSIRGYVAFGDD